MVENVLFLLRLLGPDSYARALRRLPASVLPVASFSHPVNLTRRIQTPPTRRHSPPSQPAPGGQPLRHRTPRTGPGPHRRLGHAPQAGSQGSPARDVPSQARLPGGRGTEDTPATRRTTPDPRATVAIRQGKVTIVQGSPCAPSLQRSKESGSPGRSPPLDGSPGSGPPTAACATSTASF